MKKINWKAPKTKELLRWIAVGLVLLALIGAVIGLAVKLNRQTDIQRLGGEAYSIGILDEMGEKKDGNTSIYTRRAIAVDGLTCKLKFNAKIKYKLFFYDEDDAFISSTEDLTADFDGKGIPGNADSVRIMITPLEDDRVTLTEVLDYAKQLTVTVNR